MENTIHRVDSQKLDLQQKFSHLTEEEMNKLLENPELKLSQEERAELQSLLKSISDTTKSEDIAEVLQTSPEAPKTKKLSARAKAFLFSVLIAVGAVSGDLAQDGKLNAYGFTGNGGGDNNKTELPLSMNNDGEAKAQMISLSEAQKENLTPEEEVVFNLFIKCLDGYSKIQDINDDIENHSDKIGYKERYEGRLNELEKAIIQIKGAQESLETFFAIKDGETTNIDSEALNKVKEKVFNSFNKKGSILEGKDINFLDPEAVIIKLNDAKQAYLDAIKKSQEENPEIKELNENNDSGSTDNSNTNNMVKNVDKQDQESVEKEIASLEAQIDEARAKEKEYYTTNAQTIATNYKNAIALYLVNGINKDDLIKSKKPYDRLIEEYNGKKLIGAKTLMKINSDELALAKKNVNEVLNPELTPEYKKALEELKKSEKELEKTLEEGRILDAKLKQAKTILDALNSVSQK